MSNTLVPLSDPTTSSSLRVAKRTCAYQPNVLYEEQFDVAVDQLRVLHVNTEIGDTCDANSQHPSETTDAACTSISTTSFKYEEARRTGKWSLPTIRIMARTSSTSSDDESPFASSHNVPFYVNAHERPSNLRPPAKRQRLRRTDDEYLGADGLDLLQQA